MGRTTAQETLERIADPALRVAPYTSSLRQLEGRLGLDLAATIRSLEALPLAHDGAAHRVRRDRIARTLAARRPRVMAALPGIVAKALAPLGRDGVADVMEEVATPLVLDLIGLLTGTDIPPEETLASRVFSQRAGVARRRRMEAELARLWDRLEAAGAGPEELAMTILGRDALIATLARSLHAHLAALEEEGADLRARSMPAMPERTGVPYIDRHDPATGRTLRCQLELLEGEPEAMRRGFFGAGAHACLGRPLSLAVMAEVSAQLHRLDRRVAILDYALRRDDVFHFPEVFRVRSEAAAP